MKDVLDDTPLRAMQAWEAAYDRTLRADKKAGRPYDRHRYERVAHRARVKVLGGCDRKPGTCNKCPRPDAPKAPSAVPTPKPKEEA